MMVCLHFWKCPCSTLDRILDTDDQFVIHQCLDFDGRISQCSRFSAGPDKIIPQIFKDLVSRSNGSAGLIFLKSPTKLINLIGEGKIPKPPRPFFLARSLSPS